MTQSQIQPAEVHKPSRFTADLLSQAERARCVEQGLTGLYRWYLARSQATRNWNPDTSFAWRDLRQDHPDEMHSVVEGFYAVEQYVPDYVHTLLRVIRESYGRSHFHVRWGSEEAKHADLWRNAVLSLGRRSRQWIDDYTATLRGGSWNLPWDDALHMFFYTVFQERATQVNYLNLGLRMFDESSGWPADAVLAGACRTIAVDEAAHYNFFLDAARLMLSYYPVDAASAMADVMRHFSMPARHIIPDYDKFATILHDTGIFGRRVFYRDVVQVALRQLGGDDVRAIEAGIRRSREVPSPDGALRTTAIFEAIDHEFVEGRTRRLFSRVDAFARAHGLSHTLNAEFQIARQRVPASPVFDVPI